MARNGDNAPVGQTCPKIDDVISSIKEIYLASEEMSKREMEDIEATMEKIRKDNSELREWGNQMYNELAEMEKDRDYYRDRVEALEREVDDLKYEIRELEKQVG